MEASKEEPDEVGEVRYKCSLFLSFSCSIYFAFWHPSISLGVLFGSLLHYTLLQVWQLPFRTIEILHTEASNFPNGSSICKLNSCS